MEGRGSTPTAQLTNEKCTSGGSQEPLWGQESKRRGPAPFPEELQPWSPVQTTCPWSPPNPHTCHLGVQVSKGSPHPIPLLQTIQSKSALLRDSCRDWFSPPHSPSPSLWKRHLISFQSPVFSASIYLILLWTKERGPGLALMFLLCSAGPPLPPSLGHIFPHNSDAVTGVWTESGSPAPNLFSPYLPVRQA